MEVRVESHKQEVLSELEKATEKVLFAMGLLGVEGCVEKASEIDSVTGRPTVDTGRYRAGFGFITPTQGKMTKAKITIDVVDDKTGKIKKKVVKRPQSDDISGKRSQKNTVVIANNVEYAPYLEFGSGTQKGGHHARYIMKRGIESKAVKMQMKAREILEGKQGEMLIDFSGGK